MNLNIYCGKGKKIFFASKNRHTKFMAREVNNTVSDIMTVTETLVLVSSLFVFFFFSRT